MWDRGLHSYVMVRATLAQKGDYLGRVPKNVLFPVEKVLEDGSYLSWIAPDGKSKKKGGTKIMVRVIEYTIDTNEEPQITLLITSLTDIVMFPALLLATEYHCRWEVENTIDELKVHLLGRKTPIRSQNPREVVQEVYGWLLGHWAIRSLMFQVADHAQISPLRLGNTCTLNVVRRAVPKFQRLQPEEIPFFSRLLVREILDEQIPPPEGRSNPRVVKKTRAKFPSKKPIHKRSGVKLETFSFSLLNTA